VTCGSRSEVRDVDHLAFGKVSQAAEVPMVQPDEGKLLDEAQLARLRAVGVPRRFTTGEVLVAAGERDYPFQLLKDGGAEVVRSATPSRAEMELRRWGPGEFAGEWGLITGEAAILTIRATGPGLLHEIPRDVCFSRP
jgi:CRP-like cAMP-binding protein